MIAELRRLSRLLRFALHIGVGLPIALVAHLATRSEPVARVWFRGLLNILNVKLTITGERPRGALLLAGNHISWLDIAVIMAARPVIFVSKAEVARWPVVGWMAKGNDTLFIERGANGTQQVNAEIGDCLAAGRAVVIFPEGTTTRGHGVRRFQPRLFAGAIAAGVPVQPFALRYREACVPYVDDDSMLGNLWRLLAEPELQAQLEFGPTLPPGQSRDAIAERTQQWVADRLEQPAAWLEAADHAELAPHRP